MKTSLKYLSLLGLLAFASCAYDANFKTYVMAHRQKYSAQSLILGVMVNTNPNISEADKATLNRFIEAEDLMITEAEKNLGLKN